MADNHSSLLSEFEDLRAKVARLEANKKIAPESGNTSSGEDKRASQEAEAIANGSYPDQDRARAETQTIIEENRNRRANRRLRWRYAKRVFCYLVIYSTCVLGMLIFQGFNIFEFKLSDQVLSLLVGSTAAAAIGLVYAVTSGLFNGDLK